MTLFPCGADDKGQLGLGTSGGPAGGTLTSLGEVSLPCGLVPVAVACGVDHTVVLTTDGKLLACGNNDRGQLGLASNDDQSTFQPMHWHDSAATQVACGGYHTCVVTEGGALFTCGWNSSYGQLGLGDDPRLDDDQTTLQRVELPGGAEAAQVACGGSHTVVLGADGALYSCGYNGLGQLGLGSKGEDQRTLQPVALPAGAKVAHVACGAHHTVVLTTDGALFACGFNGLGQLGLGHRTDQPTLQRVALPDEAGGRPTRVACCGCTRRRTRTRDSQTSRPLIIHHSSLITNHPC